MNTINIQTQIVEKHEFNGSKETMLKVINNINGSNGSATFDYNYTDSKSFIVDNTTGPAFNEELLALVDETASTDIVGVLLFCHKLPALVSDKEKTPVRFDISLNGTSFGSMSTFSMLNVSASTLSQINISNIAAGVGETVELKAIFVVKRT